MIRSGPLESSEKTCYTLFMSMKTEKQHDRFASFPRVLITVLSAAAIGITLLMLPFSRPREEAAVDVLFSASPLPSVTPVIAVSAVDIKLSGTPEPEVPAIDYPEGAMDLVVNGTVVCTLPSGEAAAALPEQYLSYWAALPLAEHEFLISAEIEAQINVTAPSGKGVFLSEEDALRYLIQNPSLLPVSRTLRTVEIGETVLNDQQTVSSILPPGMTVIRRLERPSYMLIYTDREYTGSTLISKVSADGFLIGSPATGRITETGEMPAPDALPSPSPAPGSLARDIPVSLSVPVKGTVTTPYGRDANGLMHYGIDYRTEAGYAVYAPGDGTVVYCGPRGNMGNVIEIRHDDSGFISRIIGLDGEIAVELFQRVKKSDRLGQVAVAPDKSKPLLRYELIRDGIPVDPLPYIK